MRYSQVFIKTLRQPPSKADTINHKLLTQAGFVDQLMAGVYSFLPLGLKVLNNISQVVREEMNEIGGQEILMPILHPKENWVRTGGWDKIDVLFKIKSRTEKEYALAQSAEEVVTPIVLSWVKSPKEFPIAVYQIQWKYRDELRAKSGIIRGREFLMKDMYSFHLNQEEFLSFYEVVKKAYIKAYKRMGLIAKVTEASGGSFSEKISYEFEVLTDAGEDNIIFCPSCDFCINSEIAKEIKVWDKCHRCGQEVLQQGKAAEVGNVFDLGQKYSKNFDMYVLDEGKKIYPFMGCYGFGITRTMGVLVEKFHDDKGIIWPDSIAPCKVYLVGLDLDQKQVKQKGDEIYKILKENDIEVLYDDRVRLSAGEKFADSDLIGIPYRLVVSSKTDDNLEVKRRDSQKTEFLSLEQLLGKLKS